MKAINLLEKLKAKPVFRVQDVERITGQSRNYSRQVLHRLKGEGLIKQVARNAYTTGENIQAIASSILTPAYISFWSASCFLGYTEQIVNTIQIATTARRKSLAFGNYAIKFIPIKEFFGYKKIHTNEGDVFVAEDEKLLIDALLRPEECGNFSEIIKIFENAKISEQKMIDYLKRAGDQTVIKRAGYLLEKTRKMDVSEAFELDRNYVILNPFLKSAAKTDKKWRVRT